MVMKARNCLELYRTGPEVTPSVEMDAWVLGAARAPPVGSRRRDLLLAGAAAAAVVAAFFLRFSMTPAVDVAGADFGRHEGRARAWLVNLDLQSPTGAGSQEGLP
jgi:hypothetical protein